MATLRQTIQVLIDRYEKYPNIKSILFAISQGVVTAEEMTTLRRYLVKVNFDARKDGYGWQTNAVGKNITREGLNQSVIRARQKADNLLDAVEDTLKKHPQTVEVVRQAVGPSLVREGIKEGQKVSAEEFNLQYKTFVRLNSVSEPRGHSVLEGTTIPVTDKFTLPSGARCDGAHDWSISNAAKEWINCGHGTIYSPYATTEQLRNKIQQ